MTAINSNSSWSKRFNTPAVNVTGRMTGDEIAFMMQGVLRLPTVFALAKSELKPEHFDRQTETEYAVLWRAALLVATANNDLLPPTSEKARALLELECSKLVANASANSPDLSSLFYNATGEPNSGLINYLYTGNTDSALDEKTVRDLLMKFLDERTVYDPLQRFVEKIGKGSVPSDLGKVIEEVKANRERIASLEVSTVEDVFPTSWETNKIVQVPTNISFLDVATDGGPALGEVMVLLGPTGGGKTLLGIMIAVNGAKYQIQQHNAGEPSGYWYYFSYESPIKPDIRRRVVSYSAQIHHNLTMKTLSDLSELSTSDRLKEYEIQRWSKQFKMGAPVAGELERYNAAIKQLGDRLRLVDMSGATHPSVGTKGVAEIAKTLSDGLSKGHTPTGIVIDYAGILVSRYMAAHNERVENEFHYLNSFVNDVRVAIAQRFNCVTWVLHQLHGDAAAASPASKQHHSKARGARNFADNANFAFNIGTKDDSNNCCVITCSKHRRADGVKDPPIVRIDGPFGSMIPEDSRYALDVGQRKIVERDVMSMIKGDSDENPFMKAPKGKSRFNPNSVL